MDPFVADRPDAPRAARQQDFVEHFADGRPPGNAERAVPVEMPVALEYDGIAYAVMMATPADLADFATGFAIAERLMPPDAVLTDVDVAFVELGVVVRARLPFGGSAPVMERARHRVAESSCGLCGIENLAALSRPLPTVPTPLALEPNAIFAALEEIAWRQVLGRATGAVHAAALCRPDGAIALVREDVGRHNALDKAIGARVRQTCRRPVFALVTARSSYELVEKAATAGLGALVAISAPTTLAIDRAHAAGLPLYVLARSDSVLRVV